jgi:hypothetical protein
MSTRIKRLSFAILDCKGKSKNEEFRKLSSEKGMRTSPTNLRWGDNLRVDDYRRKQTKKAEPNGPASGNCFLLHGNLYLNHP